ncbi:MAG: ATP-binding cassette domain-containing protein [Pirellulales bacterium]
MTADDYAVCIRGVTKTFSGHTAVDDLNLAIPRGSVYGFIGPNGSGKTTTLRMVMRILHPDRGEIEVLGQTGQKAASDRVGYLPEERGLYKEMKVRDILRFYAELKGMRRSGPAIDLWLERMGLSDWRDKKIQALSKGMAQKVQFISAVVANPELVLLDEPFSGLDPVNVVALREAVLDLRRQGTTIMMGKLLGLVGISITLAAVYLGGAYWAALHYGFDQFLAPYVLFWFLVYLVFAVLMYGALFIAVGAACTDLRETQNMLWPVMVVAMLPMFVWLNVAKEPNSSFSTIASFVPTATPMLMLVRLAVPPGIAWWQPALGVLGVLALTLVLVYAAGRIFRVGILLQGKGASPRDLVRWVIRG